MIRMSFFFSSKRRHTGLQGDWSSDVGPSDPPSTGMTAQVPETNPMPCPDQKPSFQKRRFLWACALAATAALPAAALAERFPERPISFVVPFPPGGPTDAMADRKSVV